MATTSSLQKSRSSANKKFIVWEWLNEYGKWRPYCPEVVAYIDQEGQKSKQINLGQVSPDLKMYTIDITSLCQIRQGTDGKKVKNSTSRPVRRVIYTGNSPAAHQVKWEFEGDSAGQWLAYDMQISACFEQAFHTGQQMLDLNSLFQLPYSVHFTTMQQVRMNTGRTRKIRRTMLKTPYPPAGKTPRCLSRLTTTINIIPPTGAASGALPSMSVSSSSFSAATPLSSLSVKSAGSHKRQPASSSSSDSDSDGDSVSLRTRTQLHKKMRHSQSSGGGPSGRKSSSVSSVACSTLTPITSQATLSSHGLSSTLAPTLSQQSQSAFGASSGPFSLPHTSLAATGPPLLALPLATYAQPLGSNLSHGFAPMAHLPHSIAQNHIHPNAAGGASQSQPTGSAVPALPHTQSTVLYQPNPSQNVLLQPQNIPMTTGVGNWLNGSGNLSSSHSLSSMQYSSGTVMSSFGLLPATHMPAIPMSGMLAGSHHGLSSASGSSLSLQQAHGGTAPGSSSVYHGPLTRNRLAKTAVFGLSGLGTLAAGVGGISGPGTLAAGVGGISGPGTLATGVGGIGGSSSSAFLNGGSSSFIPINHMNGMHLLGGLAQNILPPAHNVAVPRPAGTLQHPMSQGLHQMHRQLHQPHSAGSSGSGAMSRPSGYPFNMSSFGPTVGLNVLPQSSLFHPMSTPPSTGPALSGDIVTESLPAETKIVLPRQRKTKHKPKTAEEVLSRYMEAIPPRENEDCSICCEMLTAPSGFGEGHAGQFDVIQLNKCSHMFHRLCLLAMYDSSHKGDSLQCPTCKTIHGELTGNCPPGEMSWDTLHRSLQGHPHCGTIRITYYISPGIQGPDHPHPGTRFTARYFPRSGFLPDDNRGRKILKLLMVAFRRKLMFTVGTSATTGETDTVTWNEIHHKTEFGSNMSGHGYPDPNYLDNVTAELALKGVSEQDL